MPTTFTGPAQDAPRPSRPLTGRSVLLIFCGFFAVIFAMNGLFMHFAFSTFGGIDTAGAYRRNFLLTQDLQAAEQQNRLGWTVNGALRRSGDGTATLSVTANDRHGNPVHVRSLDVELRRPADKRLDAVVTTERTGINTFRGQASAVSSGQWDLLITLFNMSGERFHSRNRITIN